MMKYWLSMFLLGTVFSIGVVNTGRSAIVIDAGATYTLDAANFTTSPSLLEIAKAGITATGPSSAVDTGPDNLLDNGITGTFGGPAGDVWFNTAGNGNGGTTAIHELTFTFASPVARLGGVKIDWAWADRDDGVYEWLVNGTTSLGTFEVNNDPPAAAGGTFPGHDPSHFLFDTPQTGVTSLVLRIDKTGIGGSDAAPALAEVSFFATVPEPSTYGALALGFAAILGGSRLKRRRAVSKS